MIQANLSDPPLLEGDERGSNVEGALTFGLIGSAIELMSLMVLVRPWAQRRSGGGLILAWGIFLPWTFISAMMSLHGGSVLMLHLLWLGLILAALLGFTMMHLLTLKKGLK